MKERVYDVAIIGGGIAGATTARELAKYQADCIILEKNEDVATGASKANSAIIHAGFDAAEGTKKAYYNVKGNCMMEALCSELGVKFRRCGSLVVGFCEEDERTIRQLIERGKINGVEGLEFLTGEQVRKKEKNLSSEITCALFAPSGAITCPYELTVALVGNAMDNGVALKTEFNVKSIGFKDGIFTLDDGKEKVYSRFVVNAAGLFSGEIAALAGDGDIAIKPRRGQYMLMDKACGAFVGCTVFTVPTKLGKGVLLTPTVDGNLLAGPTSEDILNPLDVMVTSEGFSRVTEGVKKLAPSAPLGSVITAFSGNRSVGNTGDFIIRHGLNKNVIHLAGIESPGLTSAPAIAVDAVKLLRDAGLTLKQKESFNPHRKADGFFWYLSDSDKNELIKKDARYGKIVCRCESVTEGEIVHCVHANPPANSVDAVKRRTRSGMGRCQGGFCSPFVAEIIARETGRDILSVTKCGGGSVLNFSRTKEENCHD